MSSQETSQPRPALFPRRVIALCRMSVITVLLTMVLSIAFLAAALLIAPQTMRVALAAAPGAPIEAEAGLAGLFFRGSEESQTVLRAPALAADVVIDVNGPVVRATVRQRFYNPSEAWLEGIYVFPLPERSAVDRLAMTIGGRRVEGRILEKAEAKRVYEQAAREGRRASLLSAERPNVFVTSVANIGPGDEIVIEIQYQDKVAPRDRRYALRFPMVVAPRYMPGDQRPMVTAPAAPQDRPTLQRTAAGPQAPEADRDIFGPVAHPKDGPINPLSLTVRLDAGVALAGVRSLYHPVGIDRVGKGRRVVTLANGPVPADRDFVLEWQTAAADQPEAALFAEEVDGDTYLLLSLLPPASAGDDSTRPARDLIFVIDTSGSMHGESIAQAKAAIGMALARLRPDDRFNVIRFSNETYSLFLRAQPATPDTVARAQGYVAALEAGGGTEMRPALRRALGEAVDGERLRQVVFLTDGAIGYEARMFEMINDLLGQTRLFTVGIGSAPNSYFMRRTAELGRGSFTHIGDESEVTARMTALFRKLEAPALTGLRITWPDALAARPESYPAPIPDLYAGEPVTVTARLISVPQSQVEGTITLTGHRGPATWQRILPLARLQAAPGVAAVWARSKVADIEDRRHRGGDPAAARTAVIEVALRHRLVTPYTSLVAIDDQVVRPKDTPLGTAAIPRNLPHGWSWSHVFGDMAPKLEEIRMPAPLLRRASSAGGETSAVSLPQTATPASLQALVGIFFAVAGLLLVLIGLRLCRSPESAHV